MIFTSDNRNLIYCYDLIDWNYQTLIKPNFIKQNVIQDHTCLYKMKVTFIKTSSKITYDHENEKH